jgi:hypothetical protein
MNRRKRIVKNFLFIITAITGIRQLLKDESTQQHTTLDINNKIHCSKTTFQGF